MYLRGRCTEQHKTERGEGWRDRLLHWIEEIQPSKILQKRKATEFIENQMLRKGSCRKRHFQALKIYLKRFRLEKVRA